MGSPGGRSVRSGRRVPLPLRFTPSDRMGCSRRAFPPLGTPHEGAFRPTLSAFSSTLNTNRWYSLGVVW